MAPALVGDHWRVHCPHCGHRFPVNAGKPWRPKRVVCGNCRTSFDARGKAERSVGQRVVIHKLPRVTRGPRRWEVWALRGAEDDARWFVKRVVGLPGERVALRAGDVHVNDHIQRKSLAELRAMAVPVRDERFGCRSSADHDRETAWQRDSTAVSWVWTEEGWVFQRDPATFHADAAWQWLSYVPVGPPNHPAVLDDLSYNQDLSRQLNPVRDLLLQCDLSLSQDAEVAFRADSPSGIWVLIWRVGSAVLELHRDGQMVAEKKLVDRLAVGPCRVEFAYCDQQILFGRNGQARFAWDCPERPAGTAAPTAFTRIALGALSGKLTIRRLRLSRDVYYERLRGPRVHPMPVTLTTDQFFVLGDNSPCSIDSRYRTPGPVPRRALVGAVQPR